MGKIIVTLLMLTAFLFGSEGAAEGSTDIIQRTVNFLIFAGIIYYLLAEPVKNFFGGRSEAIATELGKVQERLSESNRIKETAEHKVDEAKRFAEELSEITKRENKLLTDKIMAQCEVDMETIKKQNDALMDLEKRKMVREVVSEVMGDVMTNSDTVLSKDAITDILKKKVA